jgi:hypothetical protein
MHISLRADTTISAYIYINIKIEPQNWIKFEPHSDLDLSRRNPSPSWENTYIYG